MSAAIHTQLQWACLQYGEATVYDTHTQLLHLYSMSAECALTEHTPVPPHLYQ